MSPKELTQFLRLLRRNGVVRFSDGAVSVEFGGDTAPARRRGEADTDALEEEPHDPLATESTEDLDVDENGVPAVMRPV